MPSFKDLSGNRYGRLLVTTQAPTGKRGTVWSCLCDCGNRKDIAGQNLTSGSRTSSCGSLSKEVHANRCRNVLSGLNQHESGSALRNVVLGHYKRNARSMPREWVLTDEQAYSMFASDCHCCGPPPSRVKSRNGNKAYNGSFTFNGIDRKDNKLGYTE